MAEAENLTSRLLNIILECNATLRNPELQETQTNISSVLRSLDPTFLPQPNFQNPISPTQNRKAPSVDRLKTDPKPPLGDKLVPKVIRWATEVHLVQSTGVTKKIARDLAGNYKISNELKRLAKWAAYDVKAEKNSCHQQDFMSCFEQMLSSPSTQQKLKANEKGGKARKAPDHIARKPGTYVPESASVELKDELLARAQEISDNSPKDQAFVKFQSVEPVLQQDHRKRYKNRLRQRAKNAMVAVATFRSERAEKEAGVMARTIFRVVEAVWILRQVWDRAIFYGASPEPGTKFFVMARERPVYFLTAWKGNRGELSVRNLKSEPTWCEALMWQDPETSQSWNGLDENWPEWHKVLHGDGSRMIKELKELLVDPRYAFNEVNPLPKDDFIWVEFTE